MMKRALVPLFIVICLPYLAAAPVGADALQTVAKRLTKGLAPLKSKRIAVIRFSYHNGDVSSGSSIVSERLTTFMVERGGAEVVERALLDKAMEEVRLGMTGLLDPATTQKLGKVLGVNAIVTGTLIDLEERRTEVNARLIETETGSILAAATARIHRTWEDLPRPPQARAPAEEETPVHMSKLIPTSSPRRRRAPAPVYDGPMQPLPAGSGTDSTEEVLTLTHDDLVPLNHRGQTDPERIVSDFLSDNEPPPQNAVRMARRIYHRNPDPRVRARALMAMGHLLEREGRPGQAARAYAQVLREFPDSSVLQDKARRRLRHVDALRRN